MTEIKTENFSKEFYLKEIKKCADDLKRRAEDILEDYDKGIREIEISFSILPQCVSELNVTKHYIVSGKEEYRHVSSKTS